MAYTPLTEAGQVIEPSVSVPSAIGAKFKATATAEPELEPHGLRVTSWALWVCPPMALQPDDEYDERKLAHSLKFALPKIIAPAWRNCLTTKASLLVTLFLSANEPAVVGNVPVVSMLSFSNTAIPCKGPAHFPALNSASSCLACSIAVGSILITALYLGLSAFILSI